ncbi:MAG: hypothetical protein OEY17_02425 [Nitrosopumilus sp.]|nr:hypothetical protein [Nitrosopumilus sp.]
MQEIVLILSSLAGIATAAAVRKIPRDKSQLLNLGASSHIKSQISSLKIEKDILTKTISRLYQADSEFSKIQKDRLLLKYQHQLGIVLAKLEKLEQASMHPDLGPVGDGLITLMDQKLSKLDDRLYEISSKMLTSNNQKQEVKEQEIRKQESRQNTVKSFKEPFSFEKINPKMESIEIPPSKPRQAFEITTLTNISRKEPKFPLFEKDEIKPMPEPRAIQTELVKPKEEIVQEIIQPKPKIEIIQSVSSKPKITLETKPDINKEVAKINEHKALPEPEQKELKPTTLDDDFDDDADDLDKIKGDIMKVLSKLDQAEVE